MTNEHERSVAEYQTWIKKYIIAQEPSAAQGFKAGWDAAKSDTRRQEFESARAAAFAADQKPFSIGDLITDGMIVTIYKGEEGAEFKILRSSELGLYDREVRRPWSMIGSYKKATFKDMASTCRHDWLNKALCPECQVQPAEAKPIPTFDEWYKLRTGASFKVDSRGFSYETTLIALANSLQLYVSELVQKK